MPKLAVKQFTSWSFSRWRDYLNCPLQARFKHLDRMKEEPGPALVRGTEIHEEAEKFVKDSPPVLPKSLRLFEEEFTWLLKKKATPEATWAFTKDWTACEWDDWANCWVRIKVDVSWLEDKGKTLHVVDYKTGRYREDKIDGEYGIQMKLYALGGFKQFPKVKRVITSLWFLDEGKIFGGAENHNSCFDRSQETELQEFWGRATYALFKDRDFAPRPGNHCRFCTWAKSKKGPSVYG